jgi:tetratricopeptide (TPR) repeat protein
MRMLSRRASTWLACAVVCTLPIAACSTYQPFNSIEYTRVESERRVGADLAADIAIPYEINDEIVAYLDGRITPSGSDKKKVDQILDVIFSGLGLEYQLYPTQDAIETFHSRRANCLAFTHLFVGIGRSQRLNPFYVEVEDFQRWSYQDGMIVSRGHIVAGMVVDGSLATYDFLPYRAKAYRDFKDIDDLTAMAHHYNNLGAEALIAGDLPGAEKNVLIATRLDPDFDKAINNLGVLYMRQGRLELAAHLYEDALVTYAENVPILSNLSSAYRRLGRRADADRIASQLEGMDHSNPFFFMSRGLQALEEGDPAQALLFLRDAMKIDSEVPEVHLALAKVYLSLGDMDKCRHHVERALQLDATHPEARRLAEMLGRTGSTEIVLDGSTGGEG